MSLTFDHPYCAEYAKSNRAGCKYCHSNISKDSLRLAIMVQSPFFDGKTPNWHHFGCFFKRFRPKNVGEIKNFEHLRFEDQQKVEQGINFGPPSDETSGIQKNKKRKTINILSKEFTVEYAKSNKSSCKLCENHIPKGELRIGKLDRESENAIRFGPLNRWFHVDCFKSARDELGFHWSADTMNNFETLKSEDKKSLCKKITCKDNEKLKKPKIEDVSEDDDKILKKQSDLLFNYVDELKKLRKNQIMMLFSYNKINDSKLPDNNTRRIEFLADALTFGLPQNCPLCGGCLNFKVSTYKCYGNTNGWGCCDYAIENPKRSRLKIPPELKNDLEFLKNYKFKPRQRIINKKFKTMLQNNIVQQKVKQMEIPPVKKENDKNEENKIYNLLLGYNVTYLGIKISKEKLNEFGGKYSGNIDHSVLCIISDENYLKKSKSKKIAQIKELKIPVVSEKFLTLLTTTSSLQKALIESKISFWDQSEDEIEKRIVNLNISTKIRSTFFSEDKSGTSKSSSKKLIVKDGGIIDPDSGLQDVAHVYREKNDIYSAVLNLVDVTTNKNSYYKIQLLEDDKFSTFWLFKSWGRIGTDVGDSQIKTFTEKHQAIKAFEDSYFEKTKNDWKDRHNFVKYPFSYYPVEIDYGNYEESKINIEESKSLLPLAVKELIALLFDVQNMKKTMLEFELDLEKMPLGKLSKQRIIEACVILKEISNLLLIDPLPTNQLTSSCNKFYSLVPHNFGLNRPPLINSQEMVATKNEMLESLMEIELAYEIIKNNNNEEDDVIDLNYKKLKANIEPLDKNSDDFQVIKKYVENTHAKTHDMYQLEIMNVFRIEREGEQERFTQFANNPNRMLLWHGSRLTNFVGIISQGLRIAPKEAPMTGYMFGKGIYFADSVSKSANYCCTSPNSNIGLLVLSEVAVGKSMELTEAKYIEKLNKKYKSVKGIGQSCPNPDETITMPDGVIIPIGKLIENPEVKNTSLLYNEYIVYNEKQIKIRYLVQVQFIYKSQYFI